MMTIVMNTKARRMTEMANAFKCDRCGNLYEPYNGIEYQAGCNKYHSVCLCKGLNNKYFDLCPECMTKLIEFIKAGKDEGVSNG